jgi:hypothetical protein
MSDMTLEVLKPTARLQEHTPTGKIAVGPLASHIRIAVRRKIFDLRSDTTGTRPSSSA